jgi:very-short-patch-repair endonuclease
MPRPPRSNSKTRTCAIELRKELTPAERKLWAIIRNDQLGVSFRRQHAIGNYIPDFVCLEKKLIIELDGLPFGRSIWISRNMTRKEQSIWNCMVTK